MKTYVILISIFVAINCEIESKFQFHSEIRSDGLTDWGDWGVPQFCPYPHYAVGYNTKIEGPQGKGDDTALNAIKLICSSGAALYSSQGQWGGWGNDAYCNSGEKLSAFVMKSEPSQGKGDDTAANALKLYCSNRELFNHHEAPWGRWGNLIRCQANTFICGIRTQVEPSQGKGDDTALNNVIFYCCE
jgi:hypothetical protein